VSGNVVACQISGNRVDWLHYGIREDAAMGVAETMYPHWRKRLKDEYAPPATYCKYGCCDSTTIDNPAAAVCKSSN